MKQPDLRTFQEVLIYNACTFHFRQIHISIRNNDRDTMWKLLWTYSNLIVRTLCNEWVQRSVTILRWQGLESEFLLNEKWREKSAGSSGSHCSTPSKVGRRVLLRKLKWEFTSQTILNGILQKMRTISIARVTLLGLPEWSYQNCLSGLIFLNSGF
jgi:hypothetical protein